MTVKITKPQINVREELNDLKKPTGIAGQAMLAAETPQEQFSLIGAGRKNLLINGDFQVSQRGDYTSASSANVSYFVDRWFSDVANAVSVNRQHISNINIPGTPKISKGVRLEATSSGTSYTGLRQKIENPEQYVGRTFTYSGWVRSNTPNARLTSYGNGSPNQVIVSEPHSGSGEWEKLSVTFTLNSDLSGGWFVSAFISTAGIGSIAQTTGDFIEVAMLQVEEGTVTTPFELRSYGEELALCQRYYHKEEVSSYTFIAPVQLHGSTQYRANLSLPVPLRARPTITHSGLGTWFAAGSLQAGFSAIANGYTVSGRTDMANVALTLTPSSVVLAAYQVGMLSGDGTSNVQYIAFDAEL